LLQEKHSDERRKYLSLLSKLIFLISEFFFECTLNILSVPKYPFEIYQAEKFMINETFSIILAVRKTFLVTGKKI